MSTSATMPVRRFRQPGSAEFSVDEGGTWTTSKPAWLTQFTDTNSGSTAPASFDARIEAATGVTTQASREALLEASPVTDFDLSMAKGSRNTANCYVVNGSGTHSATAGLRQCRQERRSQSGGLYLDQERERNILTGFVNHLDNGSAIRISTTIRAARPPTPASSGRTPRGWYKMSP